MKSLSARKRESARRIRRALKAAGLADAYDRAILAVFGVEVESAEQRLRLVK